VDEESESLRERLMSEVNPETGLPVFNLAVAWSILIFFVFALQCTSTLAILKKETGGWKIPMATFAGTFVLAWTGSFIVYHLLV
ncbi:MAG: ferrous iron transporter B, partial [Bdellovibrionales bacterium]|nr:ferrous iron transporter B [Bdellovibrionales bacterium]